MNLLWLIASWLSGGTPTVADAYLDDFITVEAASRFVTVPAVDRFVKVAR